MALSFKQIEAWVAEVRSDDAKERMVPDGTPNLYLNLRVSSATWLCRATVDKKRVPITIGQWPEVKATQARGVTPAIIRLLKDGFSVQAVRNALEVTLEPDDLVAIVKGAKVASDRKTPTFEEVAREWYEKHLKNGLSEGPYKRQVLQQLEDHVFPALGRRPVNEIRRREITDAISDIWRNMYPTGKKVRGNIERVFDYAVDHELRTDNPTPPPRSMPLHSHMVEHFSSLPHEQVNDFWAWLHNRPRMGVQTYVGLVLAVILGKRTGEIRHMKWEHLDLQRGIWETPAPGMKMRKTHRQPLPTQIIKLLKDLKAVSGKSELVLANAKGKPPSENAMLYAIKLYADITTHGFRATLGSWCAETGVDKRVCDLIKAHQPKYLDSAYQRTDLLEERRVVLQAWADHVMGNTPPAGLQVPVAAVGITDQAVSNSLAA